MTGRRRTFFGAFGLVAIGVGAWTLLDDPSRDDALAAAVMIVAGLYLVARARFAGGR